MRIGYGKIGRTIGLTPGSWGQVGGDNEPPVLLNKLARRNPEHEFVIVGRNSGEQPEDIGLPPNVTNLWPEIADEFRSWTKGNSAPMTPEQLERTETGLHALLAPVYDKLDGVVMWVGQHGTSNARIPKVKQGELTKPQDSFVYYAGYHIAGINRWREPDPANRKEVWLIPDVRNFLKCRDLKNPPGNILSQYDFTKKEKHWRYGDPRLPWDVGFENVGLNEKEPGIWQAVHHYEYARLEISGIPSTLEFNDQWEFRDHFGIVINEARHYGIQNTRRECMAQYVMPLQPAWVRGTWTEDSQKILGIEPTPIEWWAQWPLLQTVHATFTTPSSGSGWATTKPWEAFGVGTVCFFHPGYDDQGHIIPTTRQLDGGVWSDNPDMQALARWLRTDTPEQLAKRVAAVHSSRETWEWLVRTQRAYFDFAMQDGQIMREIEQRCGLTT